MDFYIEPNVIREIQQLLKNINAAWIKGCPEDLEGDSPSARIEVRDAKERRHLTRYCIGLECGTTSYYRG